MEMKNFLLASAAFFLFQNLVAQKFFFGDDLSYVNQMEDCGVTYKENGAAVDPYELFAAHGHNCCRVRLWHNPAWQDTLNSGKHYSDLADVKETILRARAAGMEVLLDFHLSDFWADPQRQWIPKAWLPVVDNLPVLKDSLYNYVEKTLLSLDAEGLLPEMVQIGNETNRGILLSEQVNASGWVLDWNRNSQLFKRAIEAVRQVEFQTGKKVKVAIHIAGPADTGWLMKGFWDNGVKDFDIIGISYYWAWHKPTTIDDCGNTVAQMKQLYGKEVMVFETGYIWTTASNDGAANIITATHPSYSPASPANQKKWLVDLTKKVIAKGGSGVFYWEPAWVSSPCWTPWGQGSHQEHATFFDFQNNTLPDGGMGWPEEDYGLTPTGEPEEPDDILQIFPDSANGRMRIRCKTFATEKRDIAVRLIDTNGIERETLAMPDWQGESIDFSLKRKMEGGIYVVAIYFGDALFATKKVYW